MSINLKGRHFLKLLDFSPEEITYLIDLSAELKRQKKVGIAHECLKGKNIALIFEKTSTRTRCAFEVAAADLGMRAVYLDPSASQLGKKESIEDTARVLGRMFDAIEYRGFGQERVETLAAYAGVPVFNGLTDEFHPTQMLADILTVKEEFGDIKGRKLTFMGDAKNNVARSLMVICAKLGMDFCACGPVSCMPAPDLVKECQELAMSSGSAITLTQDPLEGAQDASVIYTDIWLSMGENEALWESRIAELKPYQVTAELMESALPEAIFLHCLPSFHDRHTTVGEDIYERFGLPEMEVTNEVFEGAQSRVFDEAENRLHSIKAVMYGCLYGE